MGATESIREPGRDGRRNNGGKRANAGRKKVDTTAITRAWVAGELTDVEFATAVLGCGLTRRTAQRRMKEYADDKDWAAQFGAPSSEQVQ